MARHLIGELNQTLSMNLDSSPELAPPSATEQVPSTFLVVGASNAARTADALERTGQTVKRAAILGWRCTKQTAPMMAELVAEKLRGVTGQCTVVFQLYDNNFFMTRTEEGGLVPAVRSESNSRFHMLGESVMVPEEMQYSTFLLSKPILDVAKSQQKILMSPLPRYLNSGCCTVEEHTTNIKEADYKSNLENAVLACHRTLRDFTFRQGICEIRVICPWSQIRKMEGELWADPVHLNRAGFDSIAAQLITTASQSEGMDSSNQDKRRESFGVNRGGSVKRGHYGSGRSGKSGSRAGRGGSCGGGRGGRGYGGSGERGGGRGGHRGRTSHPWNH